MDDELKQEGVEQEEISVASPEGQESSDPVAELKAEKEKLEALVRTFQSRTDSATETARKAQEALQRLHEEREQQQRDQERRELEAVKDDPEAYSAIKLRQENRREFERREKALKEKEAALDAKYRDASDLSDKYGVPMSKLMDATSFEHMEVLAKLLAVESKQSTQTTQTKKEVKEPPKYLDGVSSAAGGSDESFLKLYSEGKSDDHKRAQAILKKMTGG